jgi:type 1 glutamine amidotransferase
VPYVEGSSTQLNSNLSPDELAAATNRLRAFSLRMTAYHVDAIAGLPRSADGFEKALRPVMTDRVYAISRTMPICGPEKLTPEAREKVAAALPRQAPAKPKKPRKLLVMELCVDKMSHTPFRISTMRWNKIRQFDAIFLNSTVGQVFVDPEIRASLLRFIREGGGLGALHGVSYTDMDWSEFTRLIGAGEGPHRVEKATLKIDDPASPLTAMFGGKEFEWVDEFYHFYADGPYSRARLHVLLSIDVGKSDMSRWGSFARGSRPDNDYGLSWIQSYGKGRVFYTALGHTPELFMNPPLAAHMLAGIQYVLGDLPADATPSATLAAKKKD